MQFWIALTFHLKDQVSSGLLRIFLLTWLSNSRYCYDINCTTSLSPFLSYLWLPSGRYMFVAKYGINRGSYISAHVLLNLLNELGKRDKMRGKPRILSLFLNSFNKFNKTRARLLDSIYHMTNTLKSHFWRKNVIILSLCSQRCYGRHNVSRKSINH